MNILWQTNKKARKIFNEMEKLKKSAPTDYMWCSLGAATGEIMEAKDIVSPSDVIRRTKETYPDIANAPKVRTTFKKFELEYTDNASGKNVDVIINVTETPTGYIDDSGELVTDFSNKDIEANGKLLNPETEQELLNDQMLMFEDAIKSQAKAVFGKIPLGNQYIKAVFR